MVWNHCRGCQPQISFGGVAQGVGRRRGGTTLYRHLGRPGLQFRCARHALELPLAVEPNAEPEADAHAIPGVPIWIVGRDEAIASLASQVKQHRLTTIVGPGGIGKTTVALAIAGALRDAFTDGVRFIDLAPIADPALAPSAVAAALGLPVRSGSPIPSLVSALRDRRMLLVLDNCEHVVDAVAALADSLFEGAANLHMLATSREALRANTERVHRLPPLETPPDSPDITASDALAFSAVQLFVERAAATSDNFQLLDPEAFAAGEICRRLDGIALAIQLAAGRVDALGVQGVAARLDDRFALLTRGLRTALPHHKTLSAAFDWSYEYLEPAAQAVLRRLSVLAGNFTLNSAIGVAIGEPVLRADVVSQLTHLVSTSLVNVAGAGLDFRLLDSTRAYARGKLVESGEYGRIARQHAEFFRAMFQQAEVDAAKWPIPQWLNVYGRELDNLRAALEWAFSPGGDVEIGVDLTIAAATLYSRMSLNEECRSRLELALARLDPAAARSSRRGMQLYTALGTALLYTRGAGVEATKAWMDAFDVASTLEDVDYQLRALRGLWSDAYEAGDIGAAMKFARLFESLAPRSADPADALTGDRMVGITFFYTGELSAARAYNDRALAGQLKMTTGLDVLRFQFDPRMMTSTILSKIIWLQGFPDQALAMADMSLRFAKEVDHNMSIAHCLGYTTCRLRLLVGDLDGAEQAIAALRHQASIDKLGQWGILARCWEGILLARRDLLADAVEAFERTLPDIPENSFRMQYTMFLGEYAHALSRVGDSARALQAVDKAIGICDRRAERWFYPELLRIKGDVILGHGGLGNADAAAESYQLALDWGHRQGALSWLLKAATSFAELRLAQGRKRDARNILDPIYKGFSEGFGTRDLRAAKSLLDHL